MTTLTHLVNLVCAAAAAPLQLRHHDDDGFITAEGLGNAALGIAALVLIWGALRSLGLDVIAWIGQQLGVGSP